MLEEYTVRFVPSARNDLAKKKRYILSKFKYQQYGINFDKKIKAATTIIKRSPTSFAGTVFSYRGLRVYMRCINTYLFFYIVDDDAISIIRVLKEGMNWEYTMKLWFMEDGDMC